MRALEGRAVAYERLNDYVQASTDAQAMVNIAPQNPRVRGKLFLRMDPCRAICDWERC